MIIHLVVRVPAQDDVVIDALLPGAIHPSHSGSKPESRRQFLHWVRVDIRTPYLARAVGNLPVRGTVFRAGYGPGKLVTDSPWRTQ